MPDKQAVLRLAATLVFALAPCVAHSAETRATKPGDGAPAASRKQIERGRYLMVVGSCNDCHTGEFPARDGNVPEKEWLLGSGPLGFRGPWGTTYAPNLRLTVSRLTEAHWVKFAKELRTRPPMPWFNLNQWTESDLRALYQYIKQLGPVGQPARPYLPPEKEPTPPYIQWPAPPK
jgi:mono/diheme cytochrome c family protein